MKHLAWLLTFLALATFPSCKRPIPTAPDREAIATAVANFHTALKNGDREAAMALLHEHAEILESGVRETRAEYERGHLTADMAFAKAVPRVEGGMVVRQEGTVAWTTSTSTSNGQFQNREIKTTNTELMVLSKTAEGWRIRAIHWSGH